MKRVYQYNRSKGFLIIPFFSSTISTLRMARYKWIFEAWMLVAQLDSVIPPLFSFAILRKLLLRKHEVGCDSSRAKTHFSIVAYAAEKEIGIMWLKKWNKLIQWGLIIPESFGAHRDERLDWCMQEAQTAVSFDRMFGRNRRTEQRERSPAHLTAVRKNTSWEMFCSKD